MDNVTCHPRSELVWFFINSTSVSQAMDQEVIKHVKWNYCKLLMQSLLANIEAATQHAKSISVLDAVTWIAEAAKQVSPDGVETCFQKVGFSTKQLTDGETPI
jgi:hypothetical protein